MHIYDLSCHCTVLNNTLHLISLCVLSGQHICQLIQLLLGLSHHRRRQCGPSNTAATVFMNTGLYTQALISFIIPVNTVVMIVSLQYLARKSMICLPIPHRIAIYSYVLSITVMLNSSTTNALNLHV